MTRTFLYRNTILDLGVQGARWWGWEGGRWVRNYFLASQGSSFTNHFYRYIKKKWKTKRNNIDKNKQTKTVVAILADLYRGDGGRERGRWKGMSIMVSIKRESLGRRNAHTCPSAQPWLMRRRTGTSPLSALDLLFWFRKWRPTAEGEFTFIAL